MHDHVNVSNPNEMAIHERMKAPIKIFFFGTSRRRWSTGQWPMPTALCKAIYIVFDLADGQRSTTSVMSIVFRISALDQAHQGSGNRAGLQEESCHSVCT